LSETTSHGLSEPSAWVTRFSALIPEGGRVLDLACGYGRHARYLAKQGYQVEALDSDAAALATLADVEGVHTRQADIEGGPWPYYAEVFDAIIVTNYLWRPLLPSIVHAVGEGGVLIYETFMSGQERLGRPTNPAFLLRPAELLELVRKRMNVVAFEQGEFGTAQPAMIQRLCAVRANGSILPA
jgi:SAM-dependent methyltransferase